MDMADQWQYQVQAVCGQEWLGCPPDRHGGGAGRQQAHCDPVLRMNAGAGFDPDDASDHILQDDGRGHDEPAHEAAARQVMSAYKEVQRSEEHTSELQSLMRISYAVFCLNKKNK